MIDKLEHQKLINEFYPNGCILDEDVAMPKFDYTIKKSINTKNKFQYKKVFNRII